MKRIQTTKAILLFLVVMLFSNSTLHAEDLRKVVNLSGYWKFSIGDDANWAQANYNDSDWDEIMVPSSWEREGYNDYNGYAWYRKKISIPDFSKDQPIYLLLGNIDDANEVYFNGKLIGLNGSFPPNYTTAYGQERRYTIPTNYIRHNGENTIAVKVYDSHLNGGITNGKVGIYIDEDFSYLNFVLSGEWKFKTGDSKYWRTIQYDDSNWETVHIPSEWENNGHPNYDGYAWYRRTFTIPSELKNKELYISLGKIDDYDQVYLNGELIGNVFDLEKDGDYRAKGWEYNARRVYKIPSKILTTHNTIAVRVYDKTMRGGIYEGPIGLMTRSNYEDYMQKHHKGRTFWDYIYDELFFD